MLSDEERQILSKGRQREPIRVSDFAVCIARGSYALVVDYLDDSGETAGERSAQEEDDTADLDGLPRGGFDVNVCHFG